MGTIISFRSIHGSASILSTFNSLASHNTPRHSKKELPSLHEEGNLVIPYRWNDLNTLLSHVANYRGTRCPLNYLSVLSSQQIWWSVLLPSKSWHVERNWNSCTKVNILMPVLQCSHYSWFFHPARRGGAHWINPWVPISISLPILYAINYKYHDLKNRYD